MVASAADCAHRGRGRDRVGLRRISGEVVNETGQWLELVLSTSCLDGRPAAARAPSLRPTVTEGVVVDRAYIPPGERLLHLHARHVKLSRPYGGQRPTPHVYEGTRDASSGRRHRQERRRPLFPARDRAQHPILAAARRGWCGGKFDAAGLPSRAIACRSTTLPEGARPGQTAAVAGTVYDFEQQVAEVRTYAFCAHVD